MRIILSVLDVMTDIYVQWKNKIKESNNMANKSSINLIIEAFGLLFLR